MDEKQLKVTPDFIFQLVLRRRWVILIPLCVVLIAGIFYSIITPRIYEAKTLILVEGQRVPTNFVQSIVTEETSARINTISQQILSRTNLESILKDFSLFAGPEYGGMYIEDKVNALRKNISVDVITDRRRQTDAFEISFRGKDPDKVMRVVNGLAATFIDENLKVRESQAIGTSSFLEAELETMRVRLEQTEERIKNYRKANMGELPEQLETNLRILERIQEALSNRQQSVREAKIQLAELKNQANSRQPSVVVIGGDQRPQDVGATLDELISELETLQSRYTEKHPDIIRLKKQIADMESSSGDGVSAEARIPIALRAQISEVRREIQAGEIDIKGFQDQIFRYEQRIENTPKREQELLSLRRDYQNIQASYDSLLNRKLEADIAVNMERKQKGEQFRIVDTAKLPERPVEPNMKKIFLLFVVAGFGIGGGLAFVQEYMDKSIKKPDDIEDYFELPVLTTLPLLASKKEMMVKKLNNIGSLTFAFINFCLLGVFGLISLKGVGTIAPVIKGFLGG